jgi:hypothetical protein
LLGLSIANVLGHCRFPLGNISVIIRFCCNVGRVKDPSLFPLKVAFIAHFISKNTVIPEAIAQAKSVF